MSNKQDPQGPSPAGKVRQADASDVPTLVLLNRDVQEHHASLYPADFKADPSGEELTTFFLGMINAEQPSIGIFEGAEGPVAYIWIEEVERSASPFMKPSRVVHIHHIAVKPEARGQRVGSSLLRCAYHLARQSGISQIAADHWADYVDAGRFFSRRGFDLVRI